eukprot:TRINITY_DN2223_c0_g1_i1.p1 TRINITY_DN2223_c0_g1~~TRINITY_DN2223_c0_g1_i1.p1  ORF type:complete len:354 (-),score=75.33 TRINITY_DN2223_c0_g1_i1:97-1158(-)
MAQQISDESVAMGSVPLMMGQQEFDDVWELWRKAQHLDSTSHCGFFPYTHLSKGKELSVRRAVNIPDNERIFLVYDKTIMGGGECSTVIGSFGLYNCEELPKFYYGGQKTNFVSWRKFLQGGLVVRERDRIYLDGEYISNGFTSAKKLFQFFITLRSHLSQLYPYNFVMANFFVPNEEIDLLPSQFRRGFHKLTSCISSKVRGKSVPQLLTAQDLKEKLSKVNFGEYKTKGECLLFTKGSKWVVLSSSGMLCGKKTAFTFFSWKNLLLSRSLLASHGKLYLDLHLLCFYDLTLLYAIRVYHSLLTIIFRSPTFAPPSYEQVLKIAEKTSSQTELNDDLDTLENVAWGPMLSDR